jgi:hypothetical protein
MKLAVNDAARPDLTYKDHRIVITRAGKDWRAMIYAVTAASDFGLVM